MIITSNVILNTINTIPLEFLSLPPPTKKKKKLFILLDV